MAHHGEAGFARLEALGLLVLAAGGAPPPLPVDVRAVGRVHQPDDGVVDVRAELHAVHQLGRAADRALENGRVAVRSAARVPRHPDEDEALALRDGVGADAEPGRLDRLAFDEEGDGGADPVRAEAPPVVRALDGVCAGGRVRDDAARGKGRRAVRANVAQRVGATGAVAAEEDRLAQQIETPRFARLQIAGEGGEEASSTRLHLGLAGLVG